MLDRNTADIRLELEQLITKPGERCYWYDFPWENKMHLVHLIKGKLCEIDLSTPRLYGRGTYACKYAREQHNKAEIKRVRLVWSEFYNALKERLDRVEHGEITIEEALAGGIQIIIDDVSEKLVMIRR